MTALNKQALREVAERAASDGWGYDRDEFNDAITTDVVLALLDKLEAAEKRIAEQSAIATAAEKLVRCKGRYHGELNYRALAKLFGVTAPDLPPLEHENVHYADAGEMEIAALRQRIVELEARKVCVPRIFNDEFWLSFNNRIVFREETYRSAVIKSIEAAGIGVKGE